jgi:type II secretory pathway pseudopilin PulG
MKKQKQAFTIVETLITLLAITIMIAGPLAFMYRSYHYSEFIKSKIVSFGLAQEGLELATSLRNSDLAAFQDVADDCSESCMADWDGVSSTTVFTYCSGESCKLYKSSTDNTVIYRSSGDTETGHYRYVKFTPNGTQGYTVESVAWQDVENTRVEVNLKKFMFNLVIK